MTSGHKTYQQQSPLPSQLSSQGAPRTSVYSRQTPEYAPGYLTAPGHDYIGSARYAESTQKTAAPDITEERQIRNGMETGTYFTALTVVPFQPNSAAQARVKPSSAALEEQDSCM